MVRKPETIKCPSCETDSGIPEGPILRVFYEDVRCRKCGTIIIYIGPKPELDYDSWKKNSFKYYCDPNEGRDKYLCKDLNFQLFC